MVLRFRVTAPFAFFKKPYTKTSADVYLFPPKTVILGLIAAIKGWERDSYDGYFDKTLVGIELNKIPRKVPFNVNFENTKYHKGRIQFAGYVLRDVDYTIYLSDETLYEDLKKLNPTYTPYLGTSNMLATIKNIELINAKITEKTMYSTQSVFPVNQGDAEIKLENKSFVVEYTQPFKFIDENGGRRALFKRFIFSDKIVHVKNNPNKIISVNSKEVVMY